MHSIDQNSKDIYNEIKYLLLYFFYSKYIFNSVINVRFHKNIKQHSVFNRIILRNVSPNQHIRMVSGGSYDTED